MAKIRSRAGANVQILGHQPFAVLKKHLQQARAFVFAAQEDFGIAPLEAQARRKKQKGNKKKKRPKNARPSCAGGLTRCGGACATAAARPDIRRSNLARQVTRVHG